MLCSGNRSLPAFPGSLDIKFSSDSADLGPPEASLRRWDGSTYVLVAELTGPR